MAIFKFDVFEDCYFYRSNNSYSNYYFFKNILDNYGYILDNKDDFENEIKNYNDILQFFWALDLKLHINEINDKQFNEEEIGKIKEIKEVFNVNYDSFFNFMEENYVEILNPNSKNEIIWHWFFDEFFTFIYNQNNFNKMPNTLKYFELNNGDYILINFETCKRYYKDNKKRLEEIVNNIAEKNANDKNLINFLLNESNKNSFIFLHNLASKIYKYNQENCLKKDYSKIGLGLFNEKEHILKIIKLGNLYKIYKPGDFECILEIIYGEINKLPFEEFDLSKKQIYVDNYLKFLKNDNTKFELKFIDLTHELNIKEQTSLNIFDKIFEKKPSILVSKVKNSASAYYRVIIESIFDILNKIFTGIYTDYELKEEFVIYLYEISKTIENEYFENKIQFYDEIVCAYYFYEEILKRKDDQILLFGISNALVNLCISTIEKIIRNIYVKFSKDGNFDENKSTFYQLINSDIIKSKISSGLIKIFIYYLSKSEDENLVTDDFKGFDLRNKYMHNHDNSFKESPKYAFVCFYLLISLITELYLRNEWYKLNLKI